MTTVHVLTEGFVSPNGRAFLFPMIRYRTAIRDLGIDVKIFRSVDGRLVECDVLIIDSKYYRSMWENRESEVVSELFRLSNDVKQIYWFDNTDSTGTLQVGAMPFIKRYYKSHLLKDRSLYGTPLYGGRIFTDYYHKKHAINDENPEFSAPITSQVDIDKLRVSWNPSLANYSYRGLMIGDFYQRVPLPRLLDIRPKLTNPGTDRPIAISARFGISYPKATIRYQREVIRAAIGDNVDTNRLGRRDYFDEMQRSQVAIAPFGWGEFTYRDYEAILAGCVVLKPDMSHLETWPNLYQDGKTIVSHNWDITDLAHIIDDMRSNYPNYQTLADRAQSLYVRFLDMDTGQTEFANRFAEIVTGD